MSEERRRTRICSSIDRLPAEVKTELDAMLLDNANSYADIMEWLKEQGHEISHSAIGRYALRSNQAAQRVAETIRRTQAIASAVADHPDLDYSKAASIVLMDGLMRRVSTADEEFLEMPLDKAGRLITALSRNAIRVSSALPRTPRCGTRGSRYTPTCSTPPTRRTQGPFSRQIGKRCWRAPPYYGKKSGATTT